LAEPTEHAGTQEHIPLLVDIANRLRALAGQDNHKQAPLAISTLRGQFADNGDWSADPARPAIIVGTVDMIGSRLLFSGYGRGFKSRPLHAGFLGQDVLLVHDEAHLEPAFQRLIKTIESEQTCRERSDPVPWPKLRVMELTATTRSDALRTVKDEKQKNEEPFGLTDPEKDPPNPIPEPKVDEPPIYHVWRRLKAKKALRLKQAIDDTKIAGEIGELALKRRWVKDENGNDKDANAAVLIFVRTLDDVKKVYDKLTDKKNGVPGNHVQQLTGTMRGLERDRMADPRRPDASRVFARFLKPPKPDARESERWQTEPMPGTVFLVCTSAGEVGVDISADHMVCDLSTFDSMAQRLGRVNRYGERTDTRIEVVHPATFGKTDRKTGELKADEIGKRRQKTLELLKKLPALGENQYDASPLALGNLDPIERLAAFAPEPTILPATDILFDAWALTSIRQKMPGRPPVEPYLHGIAEWEPPETRVAWRKEVEIITDDLLEHYPPADLLDDYSLKPHELLRDHSDRVFKHLELLAKRHADKPVWIVDDREAVEVTTLAELANNRRKDRINNCTILLSPSAGGLAGGVLDGNSDQADDVADITDGPDQRIRTHSDDSDYETKLANAADLRRVRNIELAANDDEDNETRRWEWYKSFPLEGGRTAKKPVLLRTHVDDVVNNAKRIVAGLSLPQEVADAVILAAELHDHGKRRERFQMALGNRDYPNVLWAKSGKKGSRLPEPFRHEFASVFDAQNNEAFNKLDDEMKDLMLHLIAAHHGRARPHFNMDEAFDPERRSSDADALAMEVPRRFARLQRKYGRWGLAYLESLLRAADWAASAEPSAYADELEAKP
jgi:CRISPR-associated endonuclease/helicase Cas3